jgi:hypothetical protein
MSDEQRSNETDDQHDEPDVEAHMRCGGSPAARLKKGGAAPTEMRGKKSSRAPGDDEPEVEAHVRARG